MIQNRMIKLLFQIIRNPTKHCRKSFCCFSRMCAVCFEGVPIDSFMRDILLSHQRCVGQRKHFILSFSQTPKCIIFQRCEQILYNLVYAFLNGQPLEQIEKHIEFLFKSIFNIRGRDNTEKKNIFFSVTLFGY